MKYTRTPRHYRQSRQILTAEEMRQADRMTIEQYGLPGLCLMENAGRCVAEKIRTFTNEGAFKEIAVVCGGGNNGGDGFVAARYLDAWPNGVTILLCADPERLRGDAAVHYQIAQNMGVSIVVMKPGAFERHAKRYEIIIDALLGTGLKGEVRGLAAEAIRWIDGADAELVVSVDIPSGICSDRGIVLGEAVYAQHTVTFATSKLGHWLYPGPEYVGTLHIVDIGIPSAAITATASRWILRGLDLAGPRRSADSHKGTYGHLYILGGAQGRTGAARMAGDAAMRAGAGLVTLGVSEAAWPGVASQCYELMSEVAPTEPAALIERLNSFDTILVGPGLGTDKETQALLHEVLPQVTRPVVVDADGLNAFAGNPEGLVAEAERVLTPHPGEAARLLGISAAEVQVDRVGAAQTLARRADATVVLKGAHTLVCRPDGTLGVCPYGNPGMASAGMGDVLGGIIGALLAGPALHRPVEGAVVWHARAGDMAAERLTQTAVRARDVIEALPAVERTCLRD